MQFRNVRERWDLYDTVLISRMCAPSVGVLPNAVPGWFDSFAAFGSADNINFFQTRNKSIGLAYNNQESRDQIPFAFRIDQIGVEFFAPSPASQFATEYENDPGRLDILSAWWEADLPNHASVTFRTNQDERLKTTAFMCPPGYGPVGATYNQGENGVPLGWSSSTNIGGQGVPYISKRWIFPTDIDVPRRATVSVEIRLTEYARTMLNALWGPGGIRFYAPHPDPGHPEPADDPILKYAVFGLRVLLSGTREVQQRGEAHV